MRGKSLIYTSLLLLLLSSVQVGPTLAKPEEGLGGYEEGAIEGLRFTPLDFPSIRLLKDVLTGRLWLLAEGIDPALSLMRREFFIRPQEGELAGLAARSPMLQAPGAAGALVPFRSPAPAFSRNILITRDFSNIPFQTEPHIAVNPRNPDHLIVGVIDYNFPSVVAYVSFDGGATWEGPRQVRFLQRDLASGGDPTVAFDRNGIAYFASISIGLEEFRIGPAIGVDLVSSIILARSEDGGLTWSEPVSAARSAIFPGEQRIDPEGRLRGEYVFTFLDKPWMTVGPDKDDPSRDAIYITYTEFALKWETFYVGELVFLGNPVMETTIKLVKSSDGGISWTAPVAVSPTVKRVFGGMTPGYAGQLTKRVLQGSQPAVAPDGTVYVAWLDSLDDGSMEGLAEIKVARSDDGGRTWSKPVTVAIFEEVGFTPRNARFRFWSSSFPQIAIGPGGEIYIVYTARPSDKSLDDGDIYFVRSLDGGATWSSPKRINDDETSRPQFFPAISVDPEGVIHVMWGDMRDDPAETKYHIYYTRSEDRGETWGFEIKDIGQRLGSTRVTDAYSNPNFGFPAGRFIGDYFSIKASDKDVYLVWADTRLGEFVGLNQKIGFARLRPVKSPEIFISPPLGSGGRDVTIMGFNFQPDASVFIEVSGSVVAFTKTNEDGEFVTKLFMPISGEGSHSVVAFDQSGNFATATFYIEFGFDTVKELQENLNSKIAALEEVVAQLSPDMQRNILEEIRVLRQSLEGLGGSENPNGATSLQEVALTIVILAIGGSVAALLFAARRSLGRGSRVQVSGG